MSIPHFEAFEPNVHLIYCVDEAVKDRVVANKPPQCGVITWQELAVLQLELVDTLPTWERTREFIKGAILYQFVSVGIRPKKIGIPPY